MDNKSLLAQIKKSFFEIILSIIVGNQLGWIGFGASETSSIPRLFILGGLGYVIYVPMFRILVPLIFCICAYIVIRFKLRGIIFVILYHYTSILIVILTTDFTSNVQKEFYHAAPDPLSIPLFVIFVVIPTLLYNAFLFYLLYYYIRQSLKKGTLGEQRDNC